MEALLFASVFTGVFGGLYWKFKSRLDKPPPTSREIRRSPEYYEWRQAVLQRDGFRCVWCKATKHLEVDHVYPFAYFPELRFDVKNGRALCSDCHKQTITYGVGARKFYEQLKKRL